MPPRPSPPSTLLFGLLAGAVLLGGCEAGPGDGRTDASDLAAALREQAAGVVAQQEGEGVAPTPLGRTLDSCLVLDDAGLAALGEGLGVDGDQAEVLNATLQQPDGPDPTVSCAIRYGSASAGAVLLSGGPTDADVDALTAELVAADFIEVPDAGAEGLPDGEVLLFEAAGFDASRAVWAADGFQISLTANDDLAAAGALLDALPVAVAEVRRVLG